ncbi:MAG: (Fe-S)-binding protein, partial [Promethearchaeota archaeon]
MQTNPNIHEEEHEIKTTFHSSFQYDKCTECGLCFNKCTVLSLPLSEAITEIKKLKNGIYSKKVIDKCTGCMACNVICPNDADPYTLIVSFWKDRYEEKGLPSLAENILPMWKKPNIFSKVMEKLPEDEKKLVAEWERNYKEPPKDHDVMIYAGCNSLMQPFLLNSEIFKGIPIFGSLDICCGEPLYRGGFWNAEKVLAEHNKKEFERMGVKKIIMPCLAGYNLFKNVYPKIFGVNLNIEIVSMIDWLYEKIKNKEINIKPLNKKVVVHDNCWPRLTDESIFEKIREIFKELGLTVIEPEHSKEMSLCCGMASVASNYSMWDFIKTSTTRIKEFKAVKEYDFVGDYCGGCNWALNLGK